MARINKGILGGFSGTVGTVVGGNWRGIDYMRSLSPARNSSNSPAQAEQRARFSVVGKFLQSMKDLLMVGFRDSAVKMTGANSAMANTLKSAITGVFPDFTILYSNVQISRGSLVNASAPVAAAAAPGTIGFSWTDNSGIGKAKAADKAILVAYCPELNHTVFANGATRSAGKDTLNVAEFKGKVVQTWISFISADRKDIATSLFTGQVTVA